MKLYFKQLHWQILIAMLLGISLTFLLSPKEEIKVNDVSKIKDKVVELKLVNVNKAKIKKVVSDYSDCKLIYNKNTNTFTIQSDKGINTVLLTNIFLIPDVKIISIYKEINSFNKYIYLLGDIFIGLLKMIIVPLIITSIIVGITNINDKAI